MPVSLHHVVIDTHDLETLPAFWAAALGWKVLSVRPREVVVGASWTPRSVCASCRLPTTR